MKVATLVASTVLVIGFAQSAVAGIIASSIGEFSSAQGQDNWFYGFFNQGPDTSNSYTAAAFSEFDTFDSSASRWEASDGLVGAQNNDFLNLGRLGGHPTGIGPSGQDSIIWAVRRYSSEVAGPVQIAFDLRKENIFNDQGGGITGRIFVDGIEVFSQLIENMDDVGVQSSIAVNVSVGSFIDFAIAPSGLQPGSGPDGPFSARADGSIFSAVIRDAVQIPEPPAWLLFGTGLWIVCLVARRPAPSDAV